MENADSLRQIGPILALGLPTIGSCIGCYIAGAASQAAMTKTEEGHGKFIGMASAPSSQTIYGFILMLLMNQRILAGSVSTIAAIFIGLVAGTAIMASAIFQGKVAATGIQATLKQPSLFGKCFAAVGILESFALFVFVFSLLIM
jgi:V/A-type H+/Na+-transporting ATPase subunit K